MEPEITRLTVQGFKSISEERSIDIAPLTVLAGANSSGKSSIMLPLLLWKQTLEAPYSTELLVIAGDHLVFEKTEQFRPRGSTNTLFSVGVTTEAGKYTHASSYVDAPIDYVPLTRPGDVDGEPARAALRATLRMIHVPSTRPSAGRSYPRQQRVPFCAGCFTITRPASCLRGASAKMRGFKT
ncbi:MAG: hypothetical protein ABSF98_00530 [Bryobacteraceae bacterium]|jgi:hypothetical protein